MRYYLTDSTPADIVPPNMFRPTCRTMTTASNTMTTTYPVLGRWRGYSGFPVSIGSTAAPRIRRGFLLQEVCMATHTILEQAHQELQLKKTAPTLVMKFGGTSVGTPEAMAQVVEITAGARQDWPGWWWYLCSLWCDQPAAGKRRPGARRANAFYAAEARLREMHNAIARPIGERPGAGGPGQAGCRPPDLRAL